MKDFYANNSTLNDPSLAFGDAFNFESYTGISAK